MKMHKALPGPRVTIAIPTYNRSEWLQAAVDSALAQTYTDLRVVIGDNGSTDDTPGVVAQIEDDRIDYVRRPTNVGQQENFNRLIEAVQTEYMLLLPDDDALYPDYLRATVAALDANPTAGFADTAFDGVDGQGNILFGGHHRLGHLAQLELESGAAFRERAMREPWPVCWSTVLMRTEAAHHASPFESRDFPVDDLGFLLRMSNRWDAVHLPDCLAAFRIHSASTTAEFSGFASDGYQRPDSHHEKVLEVRLRSIEGLQLSEREQRRLRRIAVTSHRKDLVTSRALSAARSNRRFPGLKSVLELSAADRRMLFVPRAWRLVAADLGGRRVKQLLKGAQ